VRTAETSTTWIAPPAASSSPVRAAGPGPSGNRPSTMKPVTVCTATIVGTGPSETARPAPKPRTPTSTMASGSTFALRDPTNAAKPSPRQVSASISSGARKRPTRLATPTVSAPAAIVAPTVGCPIATPRPSAAATPSAGRNAATGANPVRSVAVAARSIARTAGSGRIVTRAWSPGVPAWTAPPRMRG
jgi:hypothetical protein